MNRKVIKIIIIYFASMLLFGIIVSIGFYAIRNNKIDKIAMPYIWNNEEIRDQIGEIIHVNRNIVEKSIKSSNKMVIPYGVETKGNDYRYIVFVTLKKVDNQWVACDYSIKKGGKIS